MLLTALAFALIQWSDGWWTKAYETPCEFPAIKQELESEWKLPANKALNFKGEYGIDACYVEGKDFVYVLDVNGKFRYKLYVE